MRYNVGMKKRSEIEEKFKWDGYYAENVSFIMDVKIIFQTFYSVIARKNINTEQSYKK